MDDGRLEIADSLALALDGFREWVVLEFFEQHVCVAVNERERF